MAPPLLSCTFYFFLLLFTKSSKYLLVIDLDFHRKWEEIDTTSGESVSRDDVCSVGFGCQKPLMQSGRISNDRNPVSLGLVASVEPRKIQCVEMHYANDMT